MLARSSETDTIAGAHVLDKLLQIYPHDVGSLEQGGQVEPLRHYHAACRLCQAEKCPLMTSGVGELQWFGGTVAVYETRDVMASQHKQQP